MAKKLDLNKTVYELTQEYPELIDIMAGLGFKEITKKAMLQSVGKIMTIPKGAKMKNIPMMDVVTALMGHGFELTGAMPVSIPSQLSDRIPDGKTDAKPEVAAQEKSDGAGSGANSKTDSSTNIGAGSGIDSSVNSQTSGSATSGSGVSQAKIVFVLPETKPQLIAPT